MSANLVVVTGTGTDVGKTYASTVILYLLHRRIERLCYYKPYQTGVYEQGGTAILPDVDFVKRHSTLAVKDIHTTYALEPPLAPYQAAQQRGLEIRDTDVLKQLLELTKQYQKIVLEGAGGLYVPIQKDHFFIDFFSDLHSFPYFTPEIYLVGASGLGTLNHTLLSYEALFRRKISVKAVLLCRTSRTGDESEEGNLIYLREQLRPTPVVMIPFLRERDFGRHAFPYNELAELDAILE